MFSKIRSYCDVYDLKQSNVELNSLILEIIKSWFDESCPSMRISTLTSIASIDNIVFVATKSNSILVTRTHRTAVCT